MKKVLFILLICIFPFILRAQLKLNKAYTPPNGNYYFELANSSTTALALGCYTIISYYKATTDRGFYVITLPNKNLAANDILSLSSGASLYNNHNINLHLSLRDLFSEGLLQKLVINENNNGFINNTSLINDFNFFNELSNSNEANDQIALLFNGNTLIDASFTVDADNNIPQFLKLLPNLSFTNSCGNLVTIRFGTLQATYASIFNRPNQPNDYGYFKEFQIQRNNAIVQIAWQTAREQNNRGFEIERRSDNEPWTTVAYVATLAPTGNSSETLKYLYGDNTPLRGNLQYRLRQVDINGRATYSPVRTINVLGEENKIVIYPNPSTDGRVNISFGNVNSLRDVQVLDINGQLIQQWLSINSNSQQLTNLRRGNYFVRVIDRQTGTMTSQKLIVQ